MPVDVATTNKRQRDGHGRDHGVAQPAQEEQDHQHDQALSNRLQDCRNALRWAGRRCFCSIAATHYTCGHQDGGSRETRVPKLRQQEWLFSRCLFSRQFLCAVSLPGSGVAAIRDVGDCLRYGHEPEPLSAWLQARAFFAFIGKGEQPFRSRKLRAWQICACQCEGIHACLRRAITAWHAKSSSEPS